MSRVLAVTCMRNEAPYIVEWVAHHLSAGAEQFVVLTHDCDDGTEAVLEALPCVIHVPFTPEAGKSVQWQAMHLADRHEAVRGAEWVIFCDSDEFLCVAEGLSGFGDVIARAPEADAIALEWRLFGSGGQMVWGDGLTPERFTQAAPGDLHMPAGHFFKTLYRRDAFQKMGVHRPKRRKDSAPKWSVGGGPILPEGFATNDQRINLYGIPTVGAVARLNHYSVRSAQEFMVKSTRGLPNRSDKALDLGYWAERNFNAVEDTAIAHMMPATRAKMAELMALPGVAAAHEAGVAWHRARFEALMQDKASVRMYWQLGLLGDSRPPAADDVRAHVARLVKAGQDG